MGVTLRAILEPTNGPTDWGAPIAGMIARCSPNSLVGVDAASAPLQPSKYREPANARACDQPPHPARRSGRMQPECNDNWGKRYCQIATCLVDMLEDHSASRHIVMIAPHEYVPCALCPRLRAALRSAEQSPQDLQPAERHH